MILIHVLVSFPLPTLRESSIGHCHMPGQQVQVEGRQGVLQGWDHDEAIGSTCTHKSCSLTGVVTFHQTSGLHGKSVHTLVSTCSTRISTCST